MDTVYGELVQEYRKATFWGALFHSGLLVYLLVAALLGFWAYLIVKKVIRYIKKENERRKVLALEDKLALQKMTIDPRYIEKKLFGYAHDYVLGIYSQNQNILSKIPMTDQIRSTANQKIIHELNVNFRKSLYNFQTSNEKVINENNSSINIVFEFDIEMTFFIDIYINHPTIQKREQKYFKQKFSFVNNNKQWILSEVGPETPIN